MSLKAEIASHELNRTVGNMLALVESERMSERLKDTDTASRSGIRRIEQFVRQLRDQIEVSSDLDVSINGLNAIQSNLQNVWNEVNAFVSNGQTAHVINALANLDGAVSTASWAFFKRSVRGSRAYGESISNVEQQAQSAIKKVSERADEVASRLENVVANTEAQLGKANEATQAIEETRVQIANEIVSLKAKFEELQGESKRSLDSQIVNTNQKADEFFRERGEEAKAVLTRLSELEIEAKNIVQIIGNVGITGNYSNRAVAESQAADFWRWVTIALFGIGVILVIVNIILNFTGKIGLDLLLARFAIAVSVALPAIYTARESARHRTNADKAKQFELELASLGPFLQKLTPEQQQEISKELVPTYFGGKSEDHKIDAPLDINQLVATLVKAVTAKG